MRRPRDPRPYLQDMLACVERIRRYINGMDQAHFHEDEVVQDAVISGLRSWARPLATYQTT